MEINSYFIFGISNIVVYTYSDLAMAKTVAKQHAMERQIAEASNICKKYFWLHSDLLYLVIVVLFCN